MIAKTIRKLMKIRELFYIIIVLVNQDKVIDIVVNVSLQKLITSYFIIDLK